MFMFFVKLSIFLGLVCVGLIVFGCVAAIRWMLKKIRQSKHK